MLLAGRNLNSKILIKSQVSNLISGREVSVKHIRYGKELKEIVFDNNYDFNFQVSNEVFCFYLKMSSVLLNN